MTSTLPGLDQLVWHCVRHGQGLRAAFGQRLVELRQWAAGLGLTWANLRVTCDVVPPLHFVLPCGRRTASAKSSTCGWSEHLKGHIVI